MTNQTSETSTGVPISDGFDFPVGPRGDNVDVFETHKIDTTLADPGYFKSFKVWHPGEDWNGRGGGDSDLGHPIYAISHGRVVEFGDYPPSWGNIVLLEHALPDGTRLWSQYAHLDQIMVDQVGQKIKRSRQIGTLGKGAKTAKYPRGRWIAHLHFEIRRAKLRIGNWRPMVLDKTQVETNYISPTPFISARRPGIFAQDTQTTADPNPTQVLVDSQPCNEPAGAGVFCKADTDYWYTAPYGFHGSMLWTYASAEDETNWAEWRPSLPEAGRWHVWAFIPESHASTTSARYRIVHADGRIDVGINQGQYQHQWAYLGTYRFNPEGGYVRLSDFTGERAYDMPLMVGFDAITWVKAD